MKTPPSPAPPAPTRKSRRQKNWTRLVPWIGGALLISLIVAGLWPKAQPVELATVARGSLELTVNEEGMTRVRNRYVISAPAGGLLRRIDWKPGALIEAGQTIIAVIEPRESDLLDTRSLVQAEARAQGAAAARDQAAALAESAHAVAQLTQTELARRRSLFAAHSISQQELDDAELRATRAAQEDRAAGFAHRVAEYELQSAQALLSRGAGRVSTEPVVITSPVSGRLLRVFQESERVVGAGVALVEVGDPSDLEARIEVLSRDAVGITPGARAELVKWGGAQPLRGRVRVIEPAAFTKVSALGVEEQRVNVIVDFLDPLEARPTLGDAYRVEARIVTWESEDVLKVPAGALFQQGDYWSTYVVANGVARQRTVRAGASNGREIEVLEGLQVGDRVVVYPGDRIDDGVRVAPMDVSAR